MTTFEHRIFDAMPVGRPVTARDMIHRFTPPPGWTVKDIAGALCKFAKLGQVAIDFEPNMGGWAGVNTYTRTDPRPNGNSTMTTLEQTATLMADGRPRTCTDVANNIGVGYPSASNILKHLRNLGLVARVKTNDNRTPAYRSTVKTGAST